MGWVLEQDEVLRTDQGKIRIRTRFHLHYVQEDTPGEVSKAIQEFLSPSG